MDIEGSLKKAISEAFQELFSHQIAAEEVMLQPTKKEFAGSYTLVTFPFLRVTKKKPEETGQMIGEYLQQECAVVGGFNVIKGFLNLEIAAEAWLSTLKEKLSDETFGDFPPNGQKVMVEYSSPNTNKPLHLGHLRNNFLGYSVAQILKATGAEVMKVQIVNDRGIHICKSMLAYERFGEGETPTSANIKGDHLIGKYYVKFDQEYKREMAELQDGGMSAEESAKKAPVLLEAQEMLQRWEDGDEATVALWKQMNGWVYEGFDATYRKMGVDFDKYYYESQTYLLGKDIIEEGLEKKVFYRKPDGSVWVDLTDEGLDEKLLLRSDGTAVYMTQDLGTADMRHQDFPFDRSIYVVGNEQEYHFKVLFLILKKLGRAYSEGMYHLSYGMVDLPTGKMKSREGTVVDADILIREMVETAAHHTQELGKIEGFTKEEADELYYTLGLGALKYFLLKVDPKRRMLFNPQESIEFQGNTGPFIQYTHARISAIIRRAEDIGVGYKQFETTAVPHIEEEERELIYLISAYPERLRMAANDYSPSTIAQYAFDLAKEYNRFYAEHSIFGEDSGLTAYRVGLSWVVAKMIKRAMSLLGIAVPERM